MLELSGLVKCAKCGYAVKMKGKYGSLSCVGRSEYKGYCDASFAGIKLAKIQELVAVEMQDYFDHFNSKVEEEEKAKHSLKGQMANIKKEIDKLLQIAEQSETLQQATVDRIEKKQKQLTSLQLEWANGVYATDIIKSRILHHVVNGNGQIIYSELSTDQKQSLLHILVNKVLLNEDGTVTIQWNK